MSTQPATTIPAVRAAGAAAQRHRFIARRARLADTDVIHGMIAGYAAQGLLLPRSQDDVHTNFDHFLVLTQAGRVVGCVALEPYGKELAEIRSLAVDTEFSGAGCGARLVRFAVAIARRRRVARVFAVTHAPSFFERLGFVAADRRSIAEKVERDCHICPKQPTCAQTAVVRTLIPLRVLPILDVAGPASDKPSCPS